MQSLTYWSPYAFIFLYPHAIEQKLVDKYLGSYKISIMTQTWQNISTLDER